MSLAKMTQTERLPYKVKDISLSDLIVIPDNPFIILRPHLYNLRITSLKY